MARIPKFQQRRLASSVVGTPGRDRSGERTFSAISQAAGSVANTFGDMAIKRQKASDQASADRAVTDYEIALQQAHQEHAAEFSNSNIAPADRTRIMQNRARKLEKQFEGTLSTANSKAMFRSAVVEPTRSRLLQEGKLAADNQVLVIGNTITANLNKTAVNTYENAKIPGMDYENRKNALRESVRISAERHIRAGQGSLSQKELKDLSEKAVIQNYEATYNAILETEPEQALQLLDDPELQEVFDLMAKHEDKYDTGADAKAAKIKEAETATIDFGKIVQRREQLAVFRENKGLIDRARQGDLSLGEIEQISDEKTRETMRQAKLKYDPLTAEEIDTISARLQVNFDVLFERKAGTTEPDYTKLRKDVGLKEVLKLQADYMDSFKNGLLTRQKLIDQASIIPDMLLEVVENNRQHRFFAFIDGLTRFNQVAAAFTGGGPTAVFSKAATEERKIRAQLTDDYLAVFEGIDFDNPLDAASKREEVVRMYQERRNANRKNYKIGDMFPTPNGPKKILGFYDDGEPDIDPNS